MAKTIIKKRWFKVVSPKLFNERAVGEIPSTEVKLIVGRTINANLATLTDDMKKQNVEVSLLIDNAEGDKAKTKMIGLVLLPTSIKRLVRKGKTRIDQTVRAITSDDQIVTFKLIFITITIVKGGVFSGLQAETKKFLIKKTAGLSYDALCEQIVSENLQSELRAKLAKIYPLRICEIREFKLERLLKAVELRRIKTELAKESKKPEQKKEEDEIVEDASEKKNYAKVETSEQVAEDESDAAEDDENSEEVQEKIE
jgi:ribosomal protein S3AE